MSSRFRTIDLKTWETIVERIKHPSKNVTIALVGKYIDLKEAYKSLCEALTHGGIANDAKVNICWVDSEDIESKGAEKMLKGMDGILVPGGFGIRGVEGKIAAVKYARENKIPYFGICLGMQCAVIETARNLAGITEREQFGVRPARRPTRSSTSSNSGIDYRNQSVQKRDLTMRQRRQHAPGRLSLQDRKGDARLSGIRKGRDLRTASSSL